MTQKNNTPIVQMFHTLGHMKNRVALDDSQRVPAERIAGEQRVIVSGDGDFLSNTYLGNGANLDLGINMVHWLSNDDTFISIHPKSAPDQHLDLSPRAQAIIGFGFLLVLPLALLTTGIIIWIRRRKR